MEFRGGTYISQVRERDVNAAMNLWSESLQIAQIKFLGRRGLSELQDELNRENPTKIDGTENVWFFCLRIKSGIIMVNVIKTAKE
ncbi:hypothetical protein HF329_12185 [Chitinophaga oryzae]|uniref:Uncharacterized protein n=1 Tax=Chitinophaga oryzae TaxID=2725414 RepID=A0AAE6ZB90_9BACT|nr:hypothetical protein [Chitinophaga oryzae]QJB29766.1 hypothetical protein HF329_12185 [Chitinophaga oryzae]